MSSKATLSIVATVIAAVLVIFFPKFTGSSAGTSTATPTGSGQHDPGRAEVPESGRTARNPGSHDSIGFASRQAFDEHFAKHGAEFGDVTRDEYLALARTLRDAPAGGSILEAVRADGVISRFDQKSGAFIAFDADRTIRTFFKPNDGARYFERQIDKAH